MIRSSDVRSPSGLRYIRRRTQFTDMPPSLQCVRSSLGRPKPREQSVSFSEVTVSIARLRR